MVDEDYNGLALDEAEGDRIAASMGDADIAFMRNHGVMVLGRQHRRGLGRPVLSGARLRGAAPGAVDRAALKPVPAELAEATARQMRLGDRESARLHLESIKRTLDREAPDYRT